MNLLNPTSEFCTEHWSAAASMLGCEDAVPRTPVLALKDVDNDGGPWGFPVGLQDLKGCVYQSDFANAPILRPRSWVCDPEDWLSVVSPLFFSSTRSPLLSLPFPPLPPQGGPCTERCPMRVFTAARGSTFSPQGLRFWTKPCPTMSSSVAPTLLSPSLFHCGGLLTPWEWSRCTVSVSSAAAEQPCWWWPVSADTLLKNENYRKSCLLAPIIWAHHPSLIQPLTWNPRPQGLSLTRPQESSRMLGLFFFSWGVIDI